MNLPTKPHSAEVDCDESYVDLSAHLDKSPIQITEKTPLDRVIEMFRALGIRYLLVTQNRQLVGILKKKDILEHTKRDLPDPPIALIPVPGSSVRTQ